jgi:hypothetical protein
MPTAGPRGPAPHARSLTAAWMGRRCHTPLAQNDNAPVLTLRCKQSSCDVNRALVIYRQIAHAYISKYNYP